MIDESQLADHIKLVNCAECGKTMLGVSEPIHPDMPREAGRILGRPYCGPCLRCMRKIGPLDGGLGSSPSQENAIRALEDCNG